MTIRSGVSRREAIAAGGIGLLAAGSAGAVGDARAPAAGKETMVSVEDATNVALTLSPDGSRIAFDLLGILWTMPVTGGPLKRLTGDFDDLAQPDWSPGGTRIAFQSYRSGNFHIWSSLCENAADVAAGRRCPVDSGQILAQYPSGCDGFEDCLATPDIEDPGQVVGQYMQRHFG